MYARVSTLITACIMDTKVNTAITPAKQMQTTPTRQMQTTPTRQMPPAVLRHQQMKNMGL